MSEIESDKLARPLFVIAFASSAGGLTALSQILPSLPRDFGAAVIVLQHVSPNHASYLADILSRRTLLKVKRAEEHDLIRPGVIYVAPPNSHLLIKLEGILTLSQTEPIHFLRPSADLLFESLAKSYKSHAIAVVLTGTGMDGVVGIKAVKDFGGVVIAQDEASSEFFGMPGTAIHSGYVDYILPLNKIAGFLDHLIRAGKPE